MSNDKVSKTETRHKPKESYVMFDRIGLNGPSVLSER